MTPARGPADWAPFAVAALIGGIGGGVASQHSRGPVPCFARLSNVSFDGNDGSSRTFSARFRFRCTSSSPSVRVMIPTHKRGKLAAYRVYFDDAHETRWGDGFGGTSSLELPAGTASAGHPYEMTVYGELTPGPGADAQLAVLRPRVEPIGGLL